MATNRIDWIDAAKGIGILLVMFGHCWLSAEYTYWLTAFHMPLFFILSGYTFSTKRPFTDFLHAKAKTLLIPYAAFALFYTVFYTLLSRTHGGGFDPVNELRLFLLQQRHTYLWFLPVLYLTNVFTYLLTKCLSGIKLVGGGYYDADCISRIKQLWMRQSHLESRSCTPLLILHDMRYAI